MDEDRTLDMNTLPSTPGNIPAEREAWGRFKLLARVGQGGFGEVYRAWDPDLEREVALKLLLPSPTGTGQSDEEYKAMLREARALASVRHPNIVPVYGIDRHDGRVGFWTDFVKGKTLSALLASQGPFGYREAVLIGLDVTRALSTVHRAGLLHRDIKAENVMREEGGHILLMDFGLSALPHLQEDIAGTPNYMAPELWQGKTATVASDIYSMGVLLFYLVTGEYPARLGGLSRAEAMAALAQKRTLMDLRSDLPDQFLRAVSRATETDPAKRFSSAGQLSEALAECIGTAVPVEAATVSVAAPIDGTERKKRPWQLRVAIVAIIL
jgi:serine/threonine-protein kinase